MTDIHGSQNLVGEIGIVTRDRICLIKVRVLVTYGSQNLYIMMLFVGTCRKERFMTVKALPRKNQGFCHTY